MSAAAVLRVLTLPVAVAPPPGRWARHGMLRWFRRARSQSGYRSQAAGTQGHLERLSSGLLGEAPRDASAAVQAAAMAPASGSSRPCARPNLPCPGRAPARSALVLLGLLAVLPAMQAATELYRTTAPASLRLTGSGSDGASAGDPVPIVVYDGESVEQVVRRTAADHRLPDSSLAPLRSLVTERTLQAVGDTALRRPLCKVPVSLTVSSELSESGEDMQKGVMLTIYEDTDPAALADQLTARYLLPALEAAKLRDLIEDIMLKHLRARVTVPAP